jgi:hypothetical protein
LHGEIFEFQIILLVIRPDLRCWFTNRRWSQLRGQRSTSALAGNQLLSNATLKRDGKALIDLVDGLSSGSVVLVSVADGDLVDHDARLGGGAAKRLPGHDNHAQAIAATLLVVVGSFFFCLKILFKIVNGKATM